MRLHRTHLDSEDPLALRWERGEDISLEAPEHERLELLVQLFDLLLMVDVGEVKLVGQYDCKSRNC